jgi:hypothetical protein
MRNPETDFRLGLHFEFNLTKDYRAGQLYKVILTRSADRWNYNTELVKRRKPRESN